MIIIKNAQIVNEDSVTTGDILIREGRIEKIASSILDLPPGCKVVDAEGLHLFPGCIDDQVHFREPGLTHKGTIYTESRAAVAGGITSFMEMPNTVPNALTQELLEEKYAIAAISSPANYSFFMGASNDNIEEVLKTDPQNVCGVKIFMGSSTGSMLVDNEKTLEAIFSRSHCLIATHCEDEATIRSNMEKFKAEFGDQLSIMHHPLIRNVEGCYLSSHLAVSLAEKHQTRLHILHISTEKETHLFRNDIPLEKKRITAEACIHHLWFCDEDYAEKGNLIKWNPAIKRSSDREGIWKALLDDRIDVIATDHAPHTLEEKSAPYSNAPSGGPLVQHALIAMLEFYRQGKISLETIARKMSHDVAKCFRIVDRGYIREGYWADLVLVDLSRQTKVDKSNILYKCGWSPFEGITFHSAITHTIVNGNIVYENGKVQPSPQGKRMQFNPES
jgi:dihydroorotase